MTETNESNIPAATIARLFHTVAFKDRNTRITEKTLMLSSEYMRLFINEALIRSNEERVAEGNSLSKIDGLDSFGQRSRDLETTEQESSTVVNVLGRSGTSHENNTQGDEFDDLAAEPSTQAKNAFNTDIDISDDMIDTKHLAKIAGILTLDF